jgi:hypothetical protein
MKLFNISALSLALVSAATVANAHVDWTRLNDADPTNYAVFHLDETGPFADGAFINVTGSQFAGFSMQVDPTFVDAGTVTSSADIFDTIVGNSGSIIVDGDVLVVSPAATQVPSPNYRDVSFEFWFKWDAPFTVAQDVRIGARSAAKVLIKRDPTTPTNDRFGLSFAHNDFVPIPGWVNGVTTWADFTEATIGDWHHIGVVTDSAGMETTSSNAVTLAHELYDAGSKAWVYFNGHKAVIGTPAIDYIDLANNSDVVGDPGGTLPRGIRAHEGTRFQIDNRAGSFKLDELTFWAVDLSAGATVAGTNVAVFGDGKGTGVATVGDWSLLN